MEALRDSTGCDASELRARLRREGYLFLRGAVPVADVLAVRREVVQVLAEDGWTAPGSDPDELLPGPRACLEGADGYFATYRRVLALQRLNELAHHDAITGLLGELLQRPLLVHPRKIARFGQPQASEYTLPHQDYRLVQGTVDALTVWLPLGHAPVALGGLRVAAGSARAGLLPVRPAKGPGGMTVDGPVPGTWASVDYQPGDLVLFHSLTVHAAMPNRTDRMRLSVDFRYQAADEPVHTGALHPHYVSHPDIPDWDELASGWSSRDSIATPPQVQEVTDFRDAWDPGLTVPAPRLVELLRGPRRSAPGRR